MKKKINNNKTTQNIEHLNKKYIINSPKNKNKLISIITMWIDDDYHGVNT